MGGFLEASTKEDVMLGQAQQSSLVLEGKARGLLCLLDMDSAGYPENFCVPLQLIQSETTKLSKKKKKKKWLPSSHGPDILALLW